MDISAWLFLPEGYPPLIKFKLIKHLIEFNFTVSTHSLPPADGSLPEHEKGPPCGEPPNAWRWFL
ncbi:hypothetical protein GGE35_001463 [Rhizobium cellulosilyticum]|uniref:Uncharacterized protein n=1 Tax=Aliirhizobium cellulosilyticum TaxID=393664 RepID=A0A7W6UYC4_9HYPH|nr:hypothetical protein [Rhizobium cellulosilyticum]MBB4445681.1 hypothetical protein [Rhizobium cellulosilyticum]